MVQQIIVLVAFIAAVVYVGRMVYKSFSANQGCSTGCGKCGAVDFETVEKQIRQKGL